ncbi:MAG: hypothetical protein DMG57_30955 [Acidobacteria bacterium]|nr:MAG: hypothetical protein DMG57_30955 [Acidobacteriota bacterium]
MRFRTPMNAIVGMTSLVLETELTRDQRQYLEIARNYAESLLSVLNDILDIQPNLDADRLELDSIEFSVRKWLDDVVHTLKPRAEEKLWSSWCRCRRTFPTSFWVIPCVCGSCWFISRVMPSDSPKRGVGKDLDHTGSRRGQFHPSEVFR